jgi:hypothetical protein
VRLWPSDEFVGAFRPAYAATRHSKSKQAAANEAPATSIGPERSTETRLTGSVRGAGLIGLGLRREIVQDPEQRLATLPAWRHGALSW